MKPHVILWPMLAIGLLNPCSVKAQAECALLAPDDARLVCFDDWAAKQTDPPEAVASVMALPTPDVPTPEVVLKNWAVQKDKSAMTDEESIFVSVQSNESVACQAYGEPSELNLMLRCMEKTTAVYISGNCHLASGFQGYGDVTYRIDDNKAQTRGFEASTDNSALGLWSGKRAIPFVKELFGGSKLTVRFTPFGMSPAKATFDIAGAEAAVADMRNACSW